MPAEQAPVAVPSIVCALMAPLALFALAAAPQIDTPDSKVPTAIEQALIERACSATELSAEIDAHRQCVDAQLLSLRADFGRDLSRLSGPDRRRIDAACNRLHTMERREAYLDCLGGQLVTLSNRLHRGKPAVPEDAAVAPSPLVAPSVASAPPARPVSSWPSAATMILGTIGSVLAAAGVVLLAVRSRRAGRPCRVCGVEVPDSDLCPACRHEAAEARRQAAVERAQNEKAQEEEERRKLEYEAEQREQRARDDEEARVREQELAQQQEQQQQQQLQTEEDANPPSHAAVIPTVPAVEEDAVFDPYAVLGVPCEAGQDDIRTAYQQAKTKYDPDLVSFLGDEAQTHFKAKAESIERAYRMLSEVPR
jgi:DnaJ-domain-containing protein 1